MFWVISLPAFLAVRIKWEITYRGGGHDKMVTGMGKIRNVCEKQLFLFSLYQVNQRDF